MRQVSTHASLSRVSDRVPVRDQARRGQEREDVGGSRALQAGAHGDEVERFGACEESRGDAEWSAIVGTAAANGEAYASFQEVGKRAVSGVFEAAFTDTTPGQRILSLNPMVDRGGRRRVVVDPEGEDDDDDEGDGGDWY